jgi:hypothetical protein
MTMLFEVAKAALKLSTSEDISITDDELGVRVDRQWMCVRLAVAAIGVAS